MSSRKPKFGRCGSDVHCQHCGNKVSVLAYGRHKGSPACENARKVNQAVTDLKLGTFDAIYPYASITLHGRPVRALAVGLDKGIEALTVVHMDGAVRQYLAGEWGPALDSVGKHGTRHRSRNADGFGTW